MNPGAQPKVTSRFLYPRKLQPMSQVSYSHLLLLNRLFDRRVAFVEAPT